MVQGLQMQTVNDMSTVHETNALANPTTTSLLADLNTGQHFYQEFVRQSPAIVDGYALTHSNKLRSDNDSVRSIHNEPKHVEII